MDPDQGGHERRTPPRSRARTWRRWSSPRRRRTRGPRRPPPDPAPATTRPARRTRTATRRRGGPSRCSRSMSRSSGMHVRQQLVGEQHRLRVLQVGHTGHDGVRVCGRPGWRARRRGRAAAPRPARTRRAGRAETAWRPGRCGSGRPAACRRVGAEPLEQAALQRAVHVLVRRRRARTRRDSTSAARSSSAASIPVELRRRRAGPRWCSTRACALDARMSYGASPQSNWVDC